MSIAILLIQPYFVGVVMYQVHCRDSDAALPEEKQQTSSPSPGQCWYATRMASSHSSQYVWFPKMHDSLQSMCHSHYSVFSEETIFILTKWVGIIFKDCTLWHHWNVYLSPSVLLLSYVPSRTSIQGILLRFHSQFLILLILMFSL